MARKFGYFTEAQGVLDANVVGSTQIAASAVTAAKILDEAISAAKLASDAVTTAKMADGQVTAAKLASDSVTTVKILDLNVTTAKVADSNITTAKIADANVTTAKIADGAATAAKLAADSVTTAKILDSNVTTAKIADDNVTTAKILNANVTAAKLLLSDTYAFSGTVTVPTPGSSTAAANKAYVDALASGLIDFKDSVIAATTAALPANTRSGNVLTADANGALPSQDDIALIVGDRFLVWNEGGGASHVNNGIYTVTDLGAVGSAWVLTRASDADTTAEVTAGMYCFVELGTTYGSQSFVQTATVAALNTTALSFVQFSGAGQITAGAGLAKSGNTLSVNTAGGLEISSDNVQIADGGVSTAKLASDAVTTVKITDANVTAAKLASDSVTTVKILDSNVTTAKIADDNVTTAKLAATSVTAAKLGAIAGDGLAGGSGAVLTVNPAAGGVVTVGAGGVAVQAATSSVNGYLGSTDFKKLNALGDNATRGADVTVNAANYDLALPVLAINKTALVQVNVLSRSSTDATKRCVQSVKFCLSRGGAGNSSQVGDTNVMSLFADASGIGGVTAEPLVGTDGADSVRVAGVAAHTISHDVSVIVTLL